MLLTEIAQNPEINREKITQIIFEVFNIPAFYLASQPTLSLYSSGNITGVVVDSGDSLTTAVPIYEGYSLPYAIKTLNFGGRDITDFLVNSLKQKGFNVSSFIDKECARDIKEKFCYSSLNYAQELSSMDSSDNFNYTFPDGSEVVIGTEKIMCPEALFDPEILGIKGHGLHTLAHKAILKSDLNIRDSLYKNIFLCGGNTLFNGLPQRFIEEFTKISDTSSKIRVNSPPERQISA